MELVKDVKTVKKYTNNKTISEANLALEELYNELNKYIALVYGQPIKLPVLVTIQSKGKHSAYAWVTTRMAWELEGELFAYELNFASETLARDFKDTFMTMVHEMLHLKNIELDIKDCSTTSQRHNKAFKASCDKVGLFVEQLGNYGWCKHADFNKCSEPLKAICEDFMNKYPQYVKALMIQRIDKKPSKIKGGKKSNQVKYVCPCCGASVRATSKVHILCLDCEQQMIREN